MKRREFQLSLAALPVLAALPASAQELNGRQIVDEVSNRHEADFELEVQNMSLIDSGNVETKRVMRRFARRGEDKQFRYLLVFDEPPGVKGVALLTWQRKGADDDQWSYLPAAGDQLKRIAAGGKSNYFMGTDFAFEDLVSEDRDQFRYERKADEKLGNADCFVVDAFPESEDKKANSGYAWRRMWIRKDNFLQIRIDYYERRTNKFLKRLTVEDAVLVQGRMWRATRTLMDNAKLNHKTRTESVSRDFKADSVPSVNFTHNFITSRRHVR
jgi:hypothetical protein